VTLTDAATRDPLWRGVNRTFDAFHWHGDAFELPPGAVSLASSELTACQAFRHGRDAYGLLFHMEMDESMVRAMVKNFDHELREAMVDAGRILTRTPNAVREMSRIGGVVFDRWADRIGSKG